MAKKTEEIWATGRRKCAVARVRIKPGTGVVVINGQAIADYMPGDALQGYACQPLKTVELENKIDVTATIDGGGKTGQAGALRHGIARALVAHPQVLILDDSSSALDYATEAALRAALRTRDADCTTFIVSQRASSVLHADLILVLSDGSVLGAGDHETLMENCEEYRLIADAQMGDRKEGA